MKVTPLVFGAWAIGGWMWGGADSADSIRAIQAAVDMGISTIDTAPVYGLGLSERLVAKALSNTPRDRVEILTKFGLHWNDSRGELHFETQDPTGAPLRLYKYGGKQAVMRSAEQCLERLKTDYIDLFQMHWPDPTTPASEMMEGLEILREQGKIRAGGVSNFNAAQMEQAQRYGVVASNQVPYSMVARDIERDVVPYCLNNGTAILAYSPLQRGLLTGKITSDFRFGKGDHRPSTRYFQKPNLDRINALLESLRPMAEAKGASLGQLVINWTLRQKGITAVLVGARNPEQVTENAGSLGFEVSQDELGFIDARLSELVLV